ncbi:MAG: helix-turn-helix domain-containing protein [Spirulina sp.]
MTSSSVPTPQPFPYNEPLRRLMAQAQIPSYRALSQRSGVSRSSLNQLRRGQIGAMRLETLQRLSQTVGVSVADLIAQFDDAKANPESPSTVPSESPPITDTAATIAALRQEYDRLQQQVTRQDQALRQQVQREALTVIESWLLMWPNAAQAAQDKPDLPASKIIPLTRPLQELLQTWAVRPIGSVGEVVSYDPQLHQSERSVQPGQSVRIRHLGYWHGDRLLHRAKVIPVEDG